MRKLLVLAAAAAFCAGISAQTSFCTSPPGYLTKAGPYAFGYKYEAAYLHGSRWQYGREKVKKAATLVSLDCRTSKLLTYRTFYGMGRKFASFALRLGHTDCSKWSSRFTLNYKSGTAATTVFSGAMVYPSNTSGMGTGKWGDCGRVPFRSSFAYNGKDQLLEDWVNSGCVLANGYTRSNYSSTYYCDGCSGQVLTSGWSIAGFSAYGVTGYWMPKQPFTGTTRCADSGVSTTADAYCYSGLTIYNDNYRTTSLRCKFRPYMYSYYTAKGAAVIAASTVSGSIAGVPVGAGCNRLHVNMGFPLVISAKTASTSSSAFANHLPTAYATYNNAWAGVPIHAQAAWNDSRTKRFSLTLSGGFRLIKKGASVSRGCPPICVAYRYRYRRISGSTTTFIWVPSTDTGRGNTFTTAYYPIHRFGVK